jgi:hypothetical protein
LEFGRIPASGGNRAIRYNRVVQKLQFLNNNRLKTAKNADFVKNMRFLEDL